METGNLSRTKLETYQVDPFEIMKVQFNTITRADLNSSELLRRNAHFKNLQKGPMLKIGKSKINMMIQWKLITLKLKRQKQLHNNHKQEKDGKFCHIYNMKTHNTSNCWYNTKNKNNNHSSQNRNNNKYNKYMNKKCLINKNEVALNKHYDRSTWLYDSDIGEHLTTRNIISSPELSKIGIKNFI
ncbi:hypothetical protein H8356DRAFT_1363612 [Neocallimastix lanati (nom. inval.)]|nr:hypothetical protein H8356DRAFT_1363612 [Neocallimastix sp. JGI-2020a]